MSTPTNSQTSQNPYHHCRFLFPQLGIRLGRDADVAFYVLPYNRGLAVLKKAVENRCDLSGLLNKGPSVADVIEFFA